MAENREETAFVQLKVRMREHLRAKLEAEAQADAISLNAAAVRRLERSFAEDDLFSSPAVRLWAILIADEFHKSGADAASRADVDTDDRVWMKDTSCRVQATFAVLERLLRDLERQPGADVGLIDLWMQQMVVSFKHRIGQLKFFDKDGNEMKSGFIERKNDNAG